MEALPARNARKSLLFAAVAIAHALVIALLLSESRTFPLEGATHIVPLSALLLPMRRRVRFAPRPLRAPAVSVAPITAPITMIFPAVSEPIRVPPAVDWLRAANQAVHAILHRRRRVAMGFPKAARSRSGLHSAPSGVRTQGRESYRTRTGETVYRTGGNCYVVSGPPPLDASQVEQQMQMSRVGCSSAPQRGPSPDNLFKSLPAYKQYHAVPPHAVKPRHHRDR